MFVRHTLSLLIISIITASTAILGKGDAMNYAIVEARDVNLIPEIVQVVNTAYNRAPWLKDGAQRTDAYALQSIFTNPDKKLYLCLDDNKVCGTVLLDASSSKPEMAMLAVDPEYQRKNNIGKLLMHHIEQEAIAMKKQDIFINVIPLGQERLITYYQRHGYVDVGEVTQFNHPELVRPEYQGKVFLHVMRKVLK